MAMLSSTYFELSELYLKLRELILSEIIGNKLKGQQGIS